MKDTLDSLGVAIRDRLKNPFVGTYILFWITWNWRILVLLWKSTEPIESTIILIGSQHLNFWRSLVAPGLCTAAYLIASPWISHWVFLYQMTVDRRRIRAKQERDLFVLTGKKALVEQQAELDKITRRAESETAERQRQAEIQRQEMKALQQKAASDQEKAVSDDMMKYDGTVYRVVGHGSKDGYYCPVCYDKDQRMVRLQRSAIQPDGHTAWLCKACKNEF